MSVRPSKELHTFPQRLGQIGWETPAPIVEPPVDRAPDATVEVPTAITPPEIVQDASGTSVDTVATVSATLAATPTPGNTLIAHYTVRSGGVPSTPSGWTAGPAFAFTGDNGGTGTLFYKVAGASESPTITVDKGGSYYGGVYIAEVNDLGDFDAQAYGEDVAAAFGLSAGPLSSAEADIAVFAAFLQGHAPNIPFTAGGSYTLLDEVAVFAGGPTGMIEWQSITGATGTQTATATSSTEHGYSWGMMSFLSRTASYWELAPEVTDSDNATYHAVAGASDDGFLLRVELEDAYAIASVTLLIGSSAAGAKTLDLYGATLADFSDEVMLGTVSMTATGTYAPDTVSFGFVPSETYQYYRIAGSGACRIFTLSMYEGSTEGVLTDHITDATDAHDASAISILDTADYYTSTDVEGALAEIGAGGFSAGPDVELVTVAATGATETVDVSVARTYDLTMDQDVTLTLTGAVTAEAWWVTLLIRQDGTGGWDVTWPGSVEWPTGGAPTIDPAINALTVVTLGTVDGGTVWLGFPTGGGGASALNDLTDVDTTGKADQDVLTWDNGTTTWIAQAAPSGSGIPATLLDAKGDIIAATAADTAARVAVGNNGEVLVARSGATPGVAWEGQAVAIVYVIDGGGSAISTGIKGDLSIPFACTLTGWRLLADTSGAIVIDVWKDTYANFPPTDADAMPGSGKEPTITASGTNAEDTSITDWTTDDIAAGDTLRFNVDSCTSITRATLTLTATRT